MIFEYAVSPALFSTADRVAMLLLAFGIDQGRLVSDYPKDKWEQFALGSIKRHAVDDFEKRAWQELLISIRKQNGLYRRPDAIWSDKLSWSENAICEHSRMQFKAIVDQARNAKCPEVVVLGVDLVSSPLIRLPASIHVPRRADLMVQATKGLIGVSSNVVLVDRNFRIDNRFLKVIVEFANSLPTKRGPAITQIKYITSDAGGLTVEQLQAECERLLAPDLPDKISVKFIFKQKGKLHDRFVLTERGGLQFSTGLDEGDGDVLVTRLSEAAWRQEWAAWERDAYRSFEIKKK